MGAGVGRGGLATGDFVDRGAGAFVEREAAIGAWDGRLVDDPAETGDLDGIEPIDGGLAPTAGQFSKAGSSRVVCESWCDACRR